MHDPILRPRAAILGLVLLASWTFGDVGRAATALPDFSAATFVPGAPIDNPYLPLVPGTTRRYEATLRDEDDPSETEALVIEDTVTTQFETVDGVQARVVRAKEWVDGLLVEDTRDFFAQDTAGNVWYLGEDTTAFEYDDEGNLISSSTEGQWRAGANGAEPGFIMPADPIIGFNYFQEHAPNDDALDQATIIGFRDAVTVPAGTFENVLDTLEFNTLEEGSEEHKLYAAGVGLVLIEEDLDDAGVPLNPIPLVSMTTNGNGGTVIPLPPAVVPGLAMLAGVGAPWIRRRWRLR
jgi:hypothetical protein